MAKQTYDPATIEPRWQRFWEERKVFRTPNPGDPDFDASKPKFYVLDMFPYPSGAGLHVGHALGYTATDVVARYYRMKGHNVLHPMGWDAFGLPAEQYAIETGQHPRVTTAQNVANYRRQLKLLGFSYDWDREFSTADPDYFRWTQWIFARLYERGLAYRADEPVWWCPALGTVLANDEVVNGRSERGDHPCERRPLKQWKLAITAYAEALLADLDTVDWSDSLKAMQREWIGRSEGAEIDFPVAGDPATRIRVFTTRPDTIFGASFLVLAPEHPLVAQVTTPAQRAAVLSYQKQATTKSELERTDLAKEKTGVPTGGYAQNPLLPVGDPRGRIPIWVADYVVIGYGTGAIMAVPAGDERDFEFARTFRLPILPIFAEAPAAERCISTETAYVNSRNGEIDLAGRSLVEAKRVVIDWLERHRFGAAKVTYRLRDWLFSRQRYWGEPFPVVIRDDDSVELVPDAQLPVVLPDLEDFQPTGRPEAALARATDWVATQDSRGEPAQRETNTMPGSAGSSWYFLRFADPRNPRAPFAKAAAEYWLPVDLYVGGTEHAVGHLLYARFWHKVLHELGLAPGKEPFQRLVNQGMIQSFAFADARGATIPVPLAAEDGHGGYRHRDTGAPLTRAVTKMSKRYHNVVNPDDVVAEHGADTLRLYEMFMGPLSDAKPWNPNDVPGVHRFLGRAWRLLVPEDDAAGRVHAHLAAGSPASAPAAAPDPAIERALHRALHKVEADIRRMAFNTAIPAMMIFVNEAMQAIQAGARLTRDQARRFVQMVAPFAPHFAEELWHRLGETGLLAYSRWPEVDAALLHDDTVELAVQVLGKVRGRIQAQKDADDATVIAAARAAVAAQLADRTVVKEIVVKNRLVNFVVK